MSVDGVNNKATSEVHYLSQGTVQFEHPSTAATETQNGASSTTTNAGNLYIPQQVLPDQSNAATSKNVGADNIKKENTTTSKTSYYVARAQTLQPGSASPKGQLELASSVDELRALLVSLNQKLLNGTINPEELAQLEQALVSLQTLLLSTAASKKNFSSAALSAQGLAQIAQNTLEAHGYPSMAKKAAMDQEARELKAASRPGGGYFQPGINTGSNIEHFDVEYWAPKTAHGGYQSDYQPMRQLQPGEQPPSELKTTSRPGGGYFQPGINTGSNIEHFDVKYWTPKTTHGGYQPDYQPTRPLQPGEQPPSINRIPSGPQLTLEEKAEQIKLTLAKAAFDLREIMAEMMPAGEGEKLHPEKLVELVKIYKSLEKHLESGNGLSGSAFYSSTQKIKNLMKDARDLVLAHDGELTAYYKAEITQATQAVKSATDALAQIPSGQVATQEQIKTLREAEAKLNSALSANMARLFTEDSSKGIKNIKTDHSNAAWIQAGMNSPEFFTLTDKAEEALLAAKKAFNTEREESALIAGASTLNNAIDSLFNPQPETKTKAENSKALGDAIGALFEKTPDATKLGKLVSAIATSNVSDISKSATEIKAAIEALFEIKPTEASSKNLGIAISAFLDPGPSFNKARDFGNAIAALFTQKPDAAKLDKLQDAVESLTKKQMDVDLPGIRTMIRDLSNQRTQWVNKYGTGAEFLRLIDEALNNASELPLG